MASRRNYLPSQAHPITPTDHRFEFQESDMWSSDQGSPISHSPEARQSIPVRSATRPWKISSSGRKATSDSGNLAASSLPVNIPDWSNVLGSQWNQNADVYKADEEDEENRDPPHVYAARQLAKRNGMVVAFSVHEGVGRTLKGRDLSRVRNAIWKQTGFED